MSCSWRFVPVRIVFLLECGGLTLPPCRFLRRTQLESTRCPEGAMSSGASRSRALHCSRGVSGGEDVYSTKRGAEFADCGPPQQPAICGEKFGLRLPRSMRRDL